MLHSSPAPYVTRRRARATSLVAAALLAGACADEPPPPGSATSSGGAAVRDLWDTSCHGTWTRDGEATYAASLVFFERVAARRGGDQTPELEAARAELVESPWTLRIAPDGSAHLDARTRNPATGALEDMVFTGTWGGGAQELVLDLGGTNTVTGEPEQTRLTGVVEGDRLTIGGPPGNPRGIVLVFARGAG
jgi:hypothetical protein